MKKKITQFEKYYISILKEQNLQLDQIREEICKLGKISGGGYFTDEQAAVIYAYRYLLNREPENLMIAARNTKNWRELQKDILQSEEYKQLHQSDLTQRYHFMNDVYTAQKNINDSIQRYGMPDYELVLEQSYSKIIHEGDTVIDIGAHAGRHTKVFQQLIGNTGFLYAFEPLPEQFAALKQELGSENVTVINKALSDRAGKMDFYKVDNYPEESGLKKRIYNREDARVEKIEVEVDMLDAYIGMFQNIAYIKLDAEGAEINILKGAVQCLKKYKPIISVEYGYPSYSVYGLEKDSLYEFASQNQYYITDLYGNIIFNIDVWRDVCDSVYWDWFLVPQEKIRSFLLMIHNFT